MIRFLSGGPELRDLVTATLTDWETAAVHEIDEDAWRAFFSTAEARDQAGAVLANVFHAAIAVSPEDIADEDWARRSQASLHAVRVGNLIIAPPWDVPGRTGDLRGGPDRLDPAAEGVANRTAEQPVVIVITPSTGFGTGHHATTRLCLRHLQRLELQGRTVLDVGTGSGVLAIAAARLGAARVTGVDNDLDALEAARENARRNLDDSGGRLEWRAGDIDGIQLLRADVVLANLTGASLRRSAVRLSRLAAGGTLIISGVLEAEADAVRGAFADLATTITREDEDSWTSFSIAVRWDLTGPSS